MTLLLVGLTLAGATHADEPSAVVLSGESKATALRLADARKRLDEQKWSEAIEALQAILNTAGNDLVALTPTHSVQARHLCQIHLASLPPEALRLYRQRYETPARKKLEPAEAGQDRQQLRKVVDEAFVTRTAEKAIDRLGDLAFERGRFDEAEEWWRLLSPLPDAHREEATRGLALVYPDLSLDPARIQAKQLLARLYRDPESGWATELDGFRARHGKTEGSLAGRKGRYADLLQALANEKSKTARAADSDWPTFGGSPGAAGWSRPRTTSSMVSATCAAPARPGASTWRNVAGRTDLRRHLPSTPRRRARSLFIRSLSAIKSWWPMPGT